MRHSKRKRYRRNPVLTPLSDLPTEIDLADVATIAYDDQLKKIFNLLNKGNNVLVECDKQLTTFFYSALRRMGRASIPVRGFIYCAGDPPAPPNPERPDLGIIGNMMREVDEAIRTGDPKKVIVIPHLDLLASSTGDLIPMAREVIGKLYSNPEKIILGFKDPELMLALPLTNVFPFKVAISGFDRKILPKLVTQREVRKLGEDSFDAYALYKYISGLNAIRFRQYMTLLLNDDISDYSDAETLKKVYRSIREATSGKLPIPDISFDQIGGYGRLKEKIKKDLFRLLDSIKNANSPEEIKRLEELLPRGFLFEGPPGTGKTLFAKAIASQIEATVIMVSGPELVQRWVGSSEENLRGLFARARAAAPSIIIFDEIDSFATQRGGDESSGNRSVNSSMVAQLLTEMDGFRKEELVFVVGTTNMAASLDEALLRPGRLEMKFRVPYPNEDDRKQIFQIYNKKWNLGLSDDLVAHIVKKTNGYVNAARGTRFSGDHIQALARELARKFLYDEEDDKVRTNPIRPITKKDIDNLDILRTVSQRRNPRRPITEVDIDNLDILRAAKSQDVDVVNMEDIGGYEAVKLQLQEGLIDPVLAFQEKLLEWQEDPSSVSEDELTELRELIPHGVIFWGPTGTGKTFFAKAVATAIGARTTVVTGADIMERWVGSSAGNVQQLFEDARDDAPAVIIFDEFDTVAPRRREAQSGGDQEQINAVGQILTEMDGFQNDKVVIVVATTNRLDALDPALTNRPGRFDLLIQVGYADATARKKILDIYNKKYKLGLDASQISDLVRKTARQFTGDKLKALCIQLKRAQVRNKKVGKGTTISQTDIESLSAIKASEEAKATDEDIYAIAAHECGHAIVSAVLQDSMVPRMVTIEGGEDTISPFHTEFKPAVGIRVTRNQVLANIAVTLSGQMSEQILVGSISTGASDDLSIATNLARSFVRDWAMGSLGGAYPPGEQSREPSKGPHEQRINDEVESILRQARDMVREILVNNISLIKNMMEQLLKQKTLGEEEIQSFASRVTLTRFHRSKRAPTSGPDMPLDLMPEKRRRRTKRQRKMRRKY